MWKLALSVNKMKILILFHFVNSSCSRLCLNMKKGLSFYTKSSFKDLLMSRFNGTASGSSASYQVQGHAQIQPRVLSRQRESKPNMERVKWCKEREIQWIRKTCVRKCNNVILDGGDEILEKISCPQDDKQFNKPNYGHQIQFGSEPNR